MVAVSALVDRPRIPNPFHVRLFHEEVAELLVVGCLCPEVVPNIVRLRARLSLSLLRQTS